MKKLVPLLLLASLACASVNAAPIDVSGSIHIDSQYPFKPSDLPNNHFISRARIDLKGEWSPSWTYKVRISRPSNYGENGGLTAVIPLVVVSWKAFDEQMKVNFGLDTPRYSQVCSGGQSYIERNLGILEDSIGRKLGINACGIYNENYGYSLGVWSTSARASLTDYSYSAIPIDSDIASANPLNADSISFTGSTATVGLSNSSMRLAVGGRVNAVLLDTKNICWGTGLGVQSLDVIVPLVAQYTDTDSAVYYNTFEKRIALTADHSIGWKKFTLNTAAHYFKYYRDTNVSSDKNSIPDGINAFQSKNQALSGYVELTGLVIGEGYKIDKATGVVSKITPNEKYGSVEVALRAGREYYYNAAAAQFLKKSFNGTAELPMTFTNEEGYNLAVLGPNTDKDLVVRATGYTLSSSYTMDKNITFKAEYYHIKTSSKANGLWTTLEKEEGIRIRSEYQFG